MSTLIFVHDRLVETSIVRKWENFAERFALINRGGILTIVLLAAILSGLCASVAMRYWIAGAGFGVQAANRRLLQTRDELAGAELALRLAEAGLSASDGDILATMEKISTIRYVTPQSVASFFSVSTP